MNTDKQDEVINQLYQQRKSAVSAPDIHLSANMAYKTAPFSWTKLFVALFGGGLASFGILAVISHLAKSPAPVNTAPVVIPRHNPVEYQVEDLAQLQAQAVEQALEKITQSLPEVPTTPVRTSNKLSANVSEFPVISTVMLNEQLMLNIKQPKLNLTASYKQMPEFPVSVKQALRSGAVTLSYQVSTDGMVEKIQVIDGNQYPAFEQSAVKALTQWRYVQDKVNNEQGREYHIIFEFITKN